MLEVVYRLRFSYQFQLCTLITTDSGPEKRQSSFIININSSREYSQMPIRETVKSHFQLLGVFLLFSETTWLTISIILGVIGAICYCVWEFALLFFSILFSSAFFILAFWLILIFLLKNTPIFYIHTFLKNFCGQYFLKKLFPCEKCKEVDCQLIFSSCCHSFHLSCIEYADQYSDANICPQCILIRQKNLRELNFSVRLLLALKNTPISLVKITIYGAVTYGCFLYLEEYWNFPYCLIQSTFKQFP